MTKEIANRFNLLVCLFMLVLAQAQAQDTMRTHLATLSSDSARLAWLSETVTAAVHSDPVATITIAGIYDSIALLQNSNLYNAKSLNMQGLAQHANGAYELALNYYIQSLDLVEETSEFELIALIYNNMATCYGYRKETSKSIEYFKKAIVICKTVGDSVRLAQANNNIGIQYVEAEDYDNARVHYDEAVSLYHALGSPLYEGITLLSRGNLNIEVAAYQAAIEDYNQAMDLVPESMVPLLHAASIAGIGSAHNRMGHHQRAEPFLLSSLEKAEKINHLEQLKESNRELSDLYESMGNFKKSLHHQRLFKEANDNMFTAAQDQAMVDALTKYESEKKQQEIALLESKNEVTSLRLSASRRRGIFYGVGLLAFAGISILLFRLKNRIQSQKEIISKSLGEKEILLREIHHRVKNNLQVISSLLGLQTEHITDSAALGALQEGQDRVQSMALIHQNLYQEDNLTGVDMKDYFVKLINSLFDSYNIREEQVQLQLDIQDLNVDVDTVIPMGLIVNELISNSLKYAFPEGRQGIIKVSLSEEEELLKLTVKDDGVGFAEEIHEQLGDSFGYRLVDAFKQQLNADIKIESIDGTKVELWIKEYELV